MKNPESQVEVCKQFGSLFSPPDENQRLGIALHTLSLLPLNALRHQADNGTCGWYVWGGELSEEPEFFQPLHVHHLVAHVPMLVPFLALSPGWRVLLAPEQTEVWYDPALLSV
ncbi:immunity protein Imm33 domain-containing protein [Cellvibrio polysaccharolyticus]